MLKSYFRVAMRSLFKNKAHSFINIAGLSIGLAVTMLIGLWIHDELSFNKYHQNYDRIGQVMTHNGDGTYSSLPIPLGTQLRSAYPSDFRWVVLSTDAEQHILSVTDVPPEGTPPSQEAQGTTTGRFTQTGRFMEPEAPAMLTLKMERGTRAGLQDPRSILLRHSLAKKLFGEKDPINQLIELDNKQIVKVTGVYAELPDNSDFKDAAFIAPWDLYVSANPWVKDAEDNWKENAFKIFVQLAPGADAGSISAKIKDLKLSHISKEKAASLKPEFFIHPMNKWHLYSKFENRKIVTSGQLKFVWFYGITGAFVLLLACINFMNLSTARSERRAREVGIRKAVGSLRTQLILQFLGESLLIVVIAFAFSLLLATLALPLFNNLADKRMSIFWYNPWFWSLSAVFILFTGLVSGSYPAFYLSSFSSVKVLKGEFKAGRFAAVPRKVLIVLQFTVSVSLIIGTLIVLQQIQYAQNRPVGYDREGLITVNMTTPEIYGHYEVMRNDLINSGAAINMAESNSPTTEVWSNQSGFDWNGKDPNLNPSFAIIKSTHDYGKTIGWQFAAGRNFSRDFASDSAGMILNESAVKYMGLKDPVGATVKYLYSDRKDQNYHVIGVIRDMLIQSPFDPVKPSIMMMDYESASVITVRLNPSMSAGEALPKIAAVFKKYNPGAPFDYTFNDEEYAKKFSAEERIGSLAIFFAVFAVFISCLGLFGLASFMVEQRTKEIGVRKILGASVLQLWGLLSKDFLKLVFISFFIAIPLSYYVMHGWLQQYNYRVAISAWVFGVTMLMALLITMATVSFQSIRASLANPVKSLRTE